MTFQKPVSSIGLIDRTAPQKRQGESDNILNTYGILRGWQEGSQVGGVGGVGGVGRSEGSER